MTALHRLLAATDFSDGAGRAVDRAYQLAAAQGASLTLVHGLGLDALTLLQGVLGDRLPEVAVALQQEARRQLEAIADAPGRPADVPVDVVVDAGSASLVVTRLAQSLPADLLLLGAHDGDVLRHALMGSTSSRLLRTSPCPVLVVRRPVAGPYRRVLVGVDFGAGTDERIRLAQAVAPEAELVLLHAFEVPFEGKLRHAGVREETVHDFRIRERERVTVQLRDLATRLGLPPATTITSVVIGDPARRLLEQETAYDCDLVALGRLGLSTTERLLLGSVTKQVLTSSSADVLVTPESPASSV
jgi:CPA2 family monovalent cation:H+ antiporter-2